QSHPRLAGRVWHHLTPARRPGAACSRGRGRRAAGTRPRGDCRSARASRLLTVDERIGRYERQLITLAKQHEPARRIQQLAGVGPLTASAITASIATGHDFTNGRQFAAWLGLVPRQYSTGGKTRLGRIT